MTTPHRRTDLKQEKVQALQALLNSMSPQPSDKQTNSEVLQRLSDKLDQLLGDGEPGLHKNEAGELVNEEGLPIIDISEPLGTTEDNLTTNFAGEALPLPNSLSPAERDVRRRECQRILDLLEQEEALENQRRAEMEEEERRAEMQKRKEAAQQEMERRKAARELQKKMGKALVGANRTAKQAIPEGPPQAIESTASQPRAPAPVKRVTFTEPESLKSQSTGPKIPTSSSSSSSTPTMKMNVVERFPAKSSTSTIQGPQPESSTRADFQAMGETPPVNQIYAPGSPGSSSDSHFELDSEGEAELDYAALHREVAKEYFEKRENLTRGMLEGDSEDSIEYVPGDATVSGSKSKSAVSHFKRERHPSRGHSMPAQSQNAIRRSIRLGKLENDQLIGGEEGESGSDGDEEMKQIIKLLTQNQVVNAGPSGARPLANQSEKEVVTSQKGPSKFKVNRSEMGRVPGTHSTHSSTPPTPVTTATRSSPKMPSTPKTAGTTETQLREEVYRLGGIPSPSTSLTMPSMIVDSPSFAPPKTKRTAELAQQPTRGEKPPSVMSSVVKESTGANPGSHNKKEGATSGKKISRFMAERF